MLRADSSSLVSNGAGSTRKALIPVERISGSILLKSGADDQVWPSRQMAGILMERLKRAGFQHSYPHLSYSGAGHVMFVGDPSHLAPGAAQRYITPRFGGTLAGSTAAWNDDWPKTLQFLAASLAP